MTPYYSELAVSVKKKVPDNLQNKLDDLSDKHDYAGHTYMEEDDDNVCYGTDTIVTYAAVNLVRENASAEVRYMMSCITFPCMYIGLVFLCIALTVLSVQQLSDSAKYRFRYQVLSKIGLGRREIQQTVFRQLSGYYLCPAILSAVPRSAAQGVPHTGPDSPSAWRDPRFQGCIRPPAALLFLLL